MSVKVIAEAGINHNCNIQNAFELVDAAIDAGADIIKFQAAIPEEVVTKQGEMAKYQIKNIGKKLTQLEMTKKIHFALSSFKEIYYYSKKKGIAFCSTSFGEKATHYLSSFDMPFWKIPSGEINNVPYLRQIAFQKKPIILSTGMSNISEIEFALEILQESGHDRNLITLLHCTSEYPANKKEINLSAIQTLKNTFKVNVGYSDHTLGIEMPIAAVALGATVIEKHITLSRKMKGPDHVASLEPKEFKQMVEDIRNVENALGDGIKRPTNAEKVIKKSVRRSIVAKTNIKKGEQFTQKNITTKRPEGGISPIFWDKIIKLKSTKNYSPDDLIEW